MLDLAQPGWTAGVTLAIRRSRSNGRLAAVLFASMIARSAAAQACFESSAAAVGPVPNSVTSADLDGDGDADLAVANIGAGTVTVILNDGGGTYGTPTPYRAGLNPTCVVAADFDADGDTDLIATHSVFNAFFQVSVLLNQGNGTFAGPVDYPVASQSYAATCADLDGDGDIDVAAANRAADTVSILLNQGDGTFAAQVQYATPTGPYSIVHADLDSDGDQDLAVGHNVATTVAVLLNQGDGTFAAFVPYDVGWNCDGLTSADLDGDGDPDLAAAQGGLHRVGVLLNHGDGSFATVAPYAVGYDPQAYPRAVTHLDVDGDGDQDLASANGNFDPNVSILVNHGDGTFAAQATFTTATLPFSLVSADVDGDSDDDLVVANRGSSSVSVLKNCGPSATPFCFGDGSSASCPCGNDGAQSHGCASSFDAAGAYLGGYGPASVSAASFVLQAQQVTGNVTLFYQGDAQQSPAILDDGLACVSGAIIRLGLSQNVNKTAIYPEPGDLPVSIKGQVPTIGGTRYYQGWYRNISAGFCPPATTNRTNGLAVAWTP